MNPDENSQTDKKSGLPVKIILISVIALIFVIIVGVLLFLFLNRDSESENTVETDQDIVTEEDQQDEEKELTAALSWSQAHDKNLTSIAVSSDGNSIAVGEYLRVLTYNVGDGSSENEYTLEHTADDIDYSKDSSKLGVGQDVYGSLLMNVSNGEFLQELHSGYSNRIEFSPDGDQVATGNRDGIVWIWNSSTGQKVATLEEDGADWIHALTYSPDGKLIAAVHKDGTVNIWDIENEEIANSVSLSGLILEMKDPFIFSPDGEMIAGSSEDGTDDIIQFWSTDDVVETKSIQVGDRIKSLAFSPDGSMIVVASHEGTAVYDVETSALICTLGQTFEDGLSDWNVAVKFVTDSSIAVARNNGDLELWELIEEAE